MAVKYRECKWKIESDRNLFPTFAKISCTGNLGKEKFRSCDAGNSFASKCNTCTRCAKGRDPNYADTLLLFLQLSCNITTTHVQNVAKVFVGEIRLLNLPPTTTLNRRRNTAVVQPIVEALSL